MFLFLATDRNMAAVQQYTWYVAWIAEFTPRHGSSSCVSALGNLLSRASLDNDQGIAITLP